jgi:hypothetical protein
VALFSRAAPSPDLRPRDYVLSDALVVTADSRVVRVDLVVRFEAQPRDDSSHLGWDERDEGAVHAVVLTLLRLTAESLDRDTVLGVRARLGDPVTHGLELAPVAGGFSPRVTTVEVSDQVPGTGGSGDHLFRVVS